MDEEVILNQREQGSSQREAYEDECEGRASGEEEESARSCSKARMFICSPQ